MDSAKRSTMDCLSRRLVEVILIWVTELNWNELGKNFIFLLSLESTHPFFTSFLHLQFIFLSFSSGKKPCDHATLSDFLWTPNPSIGKFSNDSFLLFRVRERIRNRFLVFIGRYSPVSLFQVQVHLFSTFLFPSFPAKEFLWLVCNVQYKTLL